MFNHVKMKEIILTLVNAIDVVNPILKHHHRRVAVISYHLAKVYGLFPTSMTNLIVAASFHDIGALTVSDREELTHLDVNDPKPHEILGAAMLSSFSPFDDISKILKHHHVKYSEYSGLIESDIPIEAYLLHLADRVDILLNRSRLALNQKEEVIEKISELSGDLFHPEIVDAFLAIAEKELFWFEIDDLSMDQLYDRIDFDLLNEDLLTTYEHATITKKDSGHKEKHYLKSELYNLIKTDSKIFDFIQEGSLDGMWYWDLEKPENEWMNEKFWRVFGYEPHEKEHLSSEWQDMIFKEDLEVAIENFKKHCENPDYPYDQIVRYNNKDGSVVWVRCRGVAIRDKTGKPIRMLGAHTDITELKTLQIALERKNRELQEWQDEITKLNESLKKLSNEDYLTGLYNRQMIDSLLHEEKKRADRNNRTFSVLMIDINFFKEINDEYGHLIGDKVLIDFANRLKNILREQDVKSRWGGDEFLVLLPETPYENALHIEKKINAIQETWSIKNGNEEIRYSITIGVAAYSHREDFMECVNRADKDLYLKKRLRKETIL